ncbi:MAG: hypothetical protein F4164_06195 [Gemmatimonadales bacterium]|nr:hypothetical protein [Gemmatimonadales bacterium]MYG48950.1 hypothetical protein [Gemmatimonadales bacterium]MYK02225.1 hypothetical protein [Candidatus Palauibacter ramosifaciens]
MCSGRSPTGPTTRSRCPPDRSPRRLAGSPRCHGSPSNGVPWPSTTVSLRGSHDVRQAARPPRPDPRPARRRQASRRARSPRSKPSTPSSPASMVAASAPPRRSKSASPPKSTCATTADSNPPCAPRGGWRQDLGRLRVQLPALHQTRADRRPARTLLPRPQGERGFPRTPAQLAISLAVATAEHGRRVYCGALADLITSPEEAQAADRLQQRLKVHTHPTLLIVDEIGYVPISRTRATFWSAIVAHQRPGVRPKPAEAQTGVTPASSGGPRPPGAREPGGRVSVGVKRTEPWGRETVFGDSSGALGPAESGGEASRNVPAKRHSWTSTR